MSGEKTEQPTAKRLREAREKGQVAKSQEVASTLIVLAVFLYVGLGWSHIMHHMNQLILAPIGVLDQPFTQGLNTVLGTSLHSFAWVVLPLLLLVMVAAVAGNMMQIGVLFAIDSVTPSLDKLNPKQWFKKVFSLRNLFEFIKSVIKIVVIVYASYAIIRNALGEVLLIPYNGVPAILAVLRSTMLYVLLYCGSAFVVIAALDYLLQRHFHIKQNMMSKEEVKNEYKEMEGDPQIKGKRRQLHQEMAMNDTMQRVRDSDVLVSNPTHIAVALRYDKDETPLPLINAMGEGAIAERMMKIAEEEGIPVMRNVPLARGLFEQGETNQYIPSELIEPVAEVIRWLQEMREEGRL